MTIQPNSVLRLDTRDPGFLERFRSLVAHEDTVDPAVLATVREIIAAIRQRGDAALCEYTRRFDRHEVPAVAGLEEKLVWDARTAAFGGHLEVCDHRGARRFRRWG